MVSENATITKKAILEVELSILPEGAAEATVVSLTEGQVLSELVYINNGVADTISGRIKAFMYSYVKPAKAADCIHLAESTFADAVTVTSMVVDCSKTHESDVRNISLATIRSVTIGTDESVDEPAPAAELSVTNVVMDTANSLVTFNSNQEVVEVQWNDVTVVPNLVEDTTYQYQLVGVTVEATNHLTVNGQAIVNPADGSVDFTV